MTDNSTSTTVEASVEQPQQMGESWADSVEEEDQVVATEPQPQEKRTPRRRLTISPRRQTASEDAWPVLHGEKEKTPPMESMAPSLAVKDHVRTPGIAGASTVVLRPPVNFTEPQGRSRRALVPHDGSGAFRGRPSSLMDTAAILSQVMGGTTTSILMFLIRFLSEISLSRIPVLTEAPKEFKVAIQAATDVSRTLLDAHNARFRGSRGGRR